MRQWTTYLVALSLMGALAGCCEDDTKCAIAADDWLVRAVNDDMVSNAILREHSLFPYHFVENGAALNDLGKHDLNVLICFYRANPGYVNVPSGGVSNEIYQARLRTVSDAMRAGGVEASRIRIIDSVPGGDGISSDRIVTILENEKQPGGPVPAALAVPVATPPLPKGD